MSWFLKLVATSATETEGCHFANNSGDSWCVLASTRTLHFLNSELFPFTILNSSNRKNKAAHARWIINLDALNLSLVQVSTVGRSECTTWGNFHFHTFDHVKFTFPGTCTYVFASHCNDSYQDFNIKIRRSDKNSHLIYFTVTTDGVILEVKETGITVNGNQ